MASRKGWDREGYPVGVSCGVVLQVVESLDIVGTIFNDFLALRDAEFNLSSELSQKKEIVVFSLPCRGKGFKCLSKHRCGVC